MRAVLYLGRNLGEGGEVGAEDEACLAEVQQVDDSYKVGLPADWERPPELQGDNWGFADGASDRMRANTK